MVHLTLNGTELINDPFQKIFEPWTDIFANVMGVGEIFWLFILAVLAFVVYQKTEKIEVASLFMIGSGAFFSTSSAFASGGQLSIAFLIFTAIGLTALFMKLVFFRGE